MPHTVRVANTADEEVRAVEEVIERLSEKYPDLDRDVIAATVAAEYESFAGKPVRDFVPVLVEKNTKKALKALRKA